MVLGSGIPDPGFKKAPDPGSGSATLVFGWVFYCQPWLKAEREKYEDEVDYCNQIIENLKAKNSESLLMAENTRFVSEYDFCLFTAPFVLRVSQKKNFKQCSAVAFLGRKTRK
jgi:hypothetical protein